MTASDKTRLLEEADIFDLYGCEWLFHQPLQEDDAAKVRGRLYEIHGIYVTSAKARIRSEARYVGKVLDKELSFEEMFSSMRDLLVKNIQARQMSGGPVNLMQEVLKARMASGISMEGIDLGRFGLIEEKVEKPPAPEVDPQWFRKGADSRMWDNPKWAEISEAYLRLERADDTKSIIETVDRLNQLQHNSFHILIDLQSGRMLEGASDGGIYGDHERARLNLQKVLDICHSRRDVYAFIDSMSQEVRSLLTRYRAH